MSHEHNDAGGARDPRDLIQHDDTGDGIDRRGFLRCMAWAGTGMLWALEGGVLTSKALGRTLDGALAPGADLFFVQISDSHIGFAKDPNHDVTATLGEAIRRINALHTQPAFLLHTGDISQLSKPEEFDAAQQIIGSARTRTGEVHYVPGEHDVLDGTGKLYLDRYGKRARGSGWYSFDYRGVHFVGLVNVLDLKAGGLGHLGREQLEWLERDLKGYSSSTPIVVFAHVPLWTVYPAWGWGTEDSAQALAYLRRFGSVSVLNGHIHQVMQKVEGNVTFHTAMSTAFPQPVPGTAPAPGPMSVPAVRLRDMLGLASISFTRGHKHLAVVDSTMSGVPLAAAQAEWRPYQTASAKGDGMKDGARASAPGHISIANFTFAPAVLQVRAGETITFTNDDDTAHRIASSDGSFKPSPGMDTNDRFELRLTRPGTYKYFCSIHPQMQGTIEVK